MPLFFPKSLIWLEGIEEPNPKEFKNCASILYTPSAETAILYQVPVARTEDGL
jgi:hypothetical protein